MSAATSGTAVVLRNPMQSDLCRHHRDVMVGPRRHGHLGRRIRERDAAELVRQCGSARGPSCDAVAPAEPGAQ